MTKSKGVGRGIGGGRPRTPSAINRAAKSGETADLPAVKLDSLLNVALSTLDQIMRCSQMDGARVAAAKEVLSRIDREAQAGTPDGKKAALKGAAVKRVEQGGKFSAPPPPASVSVKTVQ